MLTRGFFRSISSSGVSAQGQVGDGQISTKGTVDEKRRLDLGLDCRRKFFAGYACPRSRHFLAFSMLRLNHDVRGVTKGLYASYCEEQ